MLGFSVWNAAILIGGLIAVILILAILFRRVVSTNVVHIVQRGRETIPYGTGLAEGNVYYAWPSWLPRIGVNVIILPVSNFDLTLEDYEAYCKTATLYTSIHASKHKVEFSQDKPSSGGILTPSKGNVSPKKRSGEESTAPIKKTTKDKKNLKRL